MAGNAKARLTRVGPIWLPQGLGFGRSIRVSAVEATNRATMPPVPKGLSRTLGEAPRGSRRVRWVGSGKPTKRISDSPIRVKTQSGVTGKKHVVCVRCLPSGTI
jgi:hypothetical protein